MHLLDWCRAASALRAWPLSLECQSRQPRRGAAGNLLVCGLERCHPASCSCWTATAMCCPCWQSAVLLSPTLRSSSGDLAALVLCLQGGRHAAAPMQACRICTAPWAACMTLQSAAASVWHMLQGCCGHLHCYSYRVWAPAAISVSSAVQHSMAVHWSPQSPQ